MVHIPFLSLLSLQAVFSPFASLLKQEPISTDAVPFVNPNLHGGSLLDRAPNTGTPLLGEPLNVIISGLSSPEVLTNAGFKKFANMLGFGIECFGAHLGDPQTANLGDGHGWVNQTIELRQDYGNADIGSCLESLLGGNHFRLFRQDGPFAIRARCSLRAVSEEENLHDHHTILRTVIILAGDDKLVSDAVGVKKYKGVTYQTEVLRLTGLLPPGSDGVNHRIPTDGVTALLTIKIIK
ncbi:hypothetical protein EI94DRAFT_1755467 [Lactarius quietus]|nr:hypothetical protein EI94DRAFT_1755467 [Lactarius quietus]